MVGETIDGASRTIEVTSNKRPSAMRRRELEGETPLDEMEGIGGKTTRDERGGVEGKTIRDETGEHEGETTDM